MSAEQKKLGWNAINASLGITTSVSERNVLSRVRTTKRNWLEVVERPVCSSDLVSTNMAVPIVSFGYLKKRKPISPLCSTLESISLFSKRSNLFLVSFSPCSVVLVHSFSWWWRIVSSVLFSSFQFAFVIRFIVNLVVVLNMVFVSLFPRLRSFSNKFSVLVATNLVRFVRTCFTSRPNTTRSRTSLVKLTQWFFFTTERTRFGRGILI